MYVLRLFKMAENQTEYPRLEQRSVIKFFAGREVQTMKFIEECVVCMEKHVLIKKYLQMG